jgi:hypothetical protein
MSDQKVEEIREYNGRGIRINREEVAHLLAKIDGLEGEVNTLRVGIKEALGAPNADIETVLYRTLESAGPSSTQASVVTTAMLRAAVLHLKEYYEVRSSHGNLRWIVPDEEVRAALEAALALAVSHPVENKDQK